MKIKTFLGSLLMAACMVGTPSCKDETFPPITLTLNVDGEVPQSEYDTNTITLSPFKREGSSLYIQGGNGLYQIESEPDTKVADYRFNGRNQLTILPQYDEQGKPITGETSMTISDYAGNRFVLQIKVAYPEMELPIRHTLADVKGGNLTQNQIVEIEQNILSEIPVKEGGRYVFTYTNPERTLGNVAIYPMKEASPLIGTFKQDKATIDREGVMIDIILPGQTFTYWLGYAIPDNRTEMVPAMMLRENVTEKYRGQYPALERAYGIQLIPERTI